MFQSVLQQVYAWSGGMVNHGRGKPLKSLFFSDFILDFEIRVESRLSNNLV
jgi:hypothetical protein